MKKVIGIVMAILIILFVICNIIFFNIFGNNKYDLQNISDSQKKEIIELLNCTEILNDIDLKELQIPKTYRDIYYQVYFETNNKDIKKYVITSDIYGRDLKELKNNNYCCTIYRNDDKSIDILEAIRKGKLLDNATSENNEMSNNQSNENNIPQDITQKILDNQVVNSGIIDQIDNNYIYYSNKDSKKYYFEKNKFSCMNGRTFKEINLSDVKVGDYIHPFEKQILVYRNLSGEELNQELLYNLTLTEDERSYSVNSIGIEEINIENENTAIVKISYGDIIGEDLTNERFSALVEFNSNTKYYSKGNNINSVNDLEIAKGNINSIILKKDSINKKSPAIVLEFESTDN